MINYRNKPQCSICSSTKHTKRKCPKLSAPLKTDDRSALTATVASQARTIEGLVEIIKVLGKPMVIKAPTLVSEPPSAPPPTDTSSNSSEPK